MTSELFAQFADMMRTAVQATADAIAGAQQTAWQLAAVATAQTNMGKVVGKVWVDLPPGYPDGAVKFHHGYISTKG